MILFPQKKQPASDNYGFALIESLIAMAIFAIGILAVASLQYRSVKNTKSGNTYSQALCLARTQLETIKDEDISSSSILNPASFPTTTSDTKNPMDENGNSGGIYSRYWTVNAYQEDTDGDGTADTDSDYARTVTVTVTFPFSGSATRSVSLTSVVTGNGL